MQSVGVQLFQKIIVGVFDNQKQVKAELASGKQVHPEAKHVTEIIDHRVSNIPSDFVGTFILEESYYSHTNGQYEVKPLFFKVSPHGPYDIYLQSVIIPDHLDKSKVVNSNVDLHFDYTNLIVNDKFGKALYHNMGDYFIVNHLANFGSGLTFNLIETLTEDQLQVMELLKKDGTPITTYSSPILYDRIS